MTSFRAVPVARAALNCLDSSASVLVTSLRTTSSTIVQVSPLDRHLGVLLAKYLTYPLAVAYAVDVGKQTNVEPCDVQILV